MAKLRLRVELNRGRTGIPLDKFARIVVEIKKFVEQLGSEAGIPKENNVWFAHEFANGSGYFTNELAAVAEVEKRGRFNTYIRSLTSTDKSGVVDYSGVPATLVEQFRRVTDPLDFDEPIGLGVYDSDEQTDPTWLRVEKLSVVSALGTVEFDSKYYGSVFGTVHSLYKGSSPPYLNVRDLVSGELVKCIYEPREHYNAVAKLLQREDALVYVHGLVTVDLVSKSIDHIDSDHFEVAPEYRDGDLDAFVGCAPNITGTLSTKQHITKIRHDG